MTAKADRYRANAEQCRRKADAAASAEDKGTWFDLAYSWLLLLKFEEGPIGPVVRTACGMARAQR
jgi:hypothetical protein